MRITEKTGLVYTALFLTVSVAVITQNSDTLMATFRGEKGVVAVDDIFTVHAGREQRLFVLRNDIDSQKVALADIRLVSQPGCGSVSQAGGSFVYTNSTSCTGHQSFSYCLNTGLGCEPASVALRLIESRDPVDSVATGPAVELAGFETQIGFNMQELEITNVHLGRVAPAETTAIPVSGAKLAKVAVEAPLSFAKPAQLTKVGAVDGVFTMENLPQTASNGIDTKTMVEVAATTDTLTDESPIDETAAQALPALPSDETSALPNTNSGALTARMVRIDMGFQFPNVMAGIDQSPFGTPCSINFSGLTIESGLVELNLKAPCQPNSRVDIQHGKLKVTVKTDHIGNLKIAVPAFETNAHFLVRLMDGTTLKTSVNVPELEHIDRVAIQWRGDFEVDLHALEFGASLQSRGHIWQGQPSAADQAERYGGGYVLQLGDRSLKDADMAEVYSLPISQKTKSGVVDFSVSAHASGQYCAGSGIVQSLRSRGGRLVGASGVAFRFPACGNSDQSIVLKNVVRDLIIATR